MWLPTDWAPENRAVSVEALKASLHSYGIKYLTLISDACRDFANRPSTANLAPDPVLGRGPVQAVQPGLDRFNAVEDGKAAFMIPGETAADARCILSGSLANALWGHEPEAFSRQKRGLIDSDSLLRFISVQTRKVGERYGLECQAEAIRGYGRGGPDMVYFDVDGPPQPVAPPIAWPPPGAPAQPLGMPANRAIEQALARLSSINLLSAWPYAIDPAGGTAALEQVPGGIDLALAIEQSEASEISERTQRMHVWQAGAAAVVAKQGLEREVRRSQRSRIRRTLRAGQRRMSPDANLIMSGGQPARVWAPYGAQRVGGAKSWQVNFGKADAVQVIIEYADGLFAPAVVYAGLSTLVTHDGNRRITGWMCAPPYQSDAARLAPTNDAIAKLQTTRLSPGVADDLAASLRHGKHVNPMLGAIAAYLYDYTGDRDNIRRMAYYYASRAQPIPFDVALLGQLHTERSDQAVTAYVPAVEARDRRDGNDVPDFARQQTNAISGMVGGFCPWLRLGWDYVATPDPIEEPMTQPLGTALPHLLDSSFTALSEEGASSLITHFGLEAKS